jgi:hypothetical protein
MLRNIVPVAPVSDWRRRPEAGGTRRPRAVVILFALVSVLAAGCSRDSVAAMPAAKRTPTREVSFKDEIQPIFSKRCIACHAPGAYEDGTAMGGLVLSSGRSAAQLVGFKSIESKLPRVAPGDLEQSYLFHKLRGSFDKVGGVGVKMPLAGEMPEDEIVLIEEWILGGAKTD